MTLFKNFIEFAANVTLTDKVIADRRAKADLFGLKAEKAHISGKSLPFVFAHQAPLYFLTAGTPASCCHKTRYRM